MVPALDAARRTGENDFGHRLLDLEPPLIGRQFRIIPIITIFAASACAASYKRALEFRLLTRSPRRKASFLRGLGPKR
jgi:hypothetical protein